MAAFPGNRRYCRSCGSGLAADSTAIKCSPCQRREGDTALAPPEVPADFWNADIIADALAAWHMGKVICAYRHHPWHGPRPLPQETVSGWLNINQAQLSRIETGSPPADLNKLIKWAEILRIPERLLWFKLPGVNSQPATPSIAKSTSFPNPPTGRLPRIAGAIPDELNGESDITVMRAFRQADRQVGGGHLYPTVVSYLKSTVAPRIFDGARSDPNLFVAAAALTEMAGWMAHDAGQNAVARQHFGRSLDLAKVGGDLHLEAHVHASMSHLFLHANEPTKAINLARQGQGRLANSPTNHPLRARLLAMEARGLAAIQQKKECGKVLLRAEKTLDNPDSEKASHWISGFDAGSLASEAARCMRQLGAYEEAEEQARRVISLRETTHTRSRAFGQIILMMVLIAQDRMEEACFVGREVLEATESLSSYLVIEQLREVQDLLLPYRSNKAVADFLHQLRDALRERFLLYRRLTADGS